MKEVRMPKVGEYWYIATKIPSDTPYVSLNVIEICKIIAVDPIIARGSVSCFLTEDIKCLSKWEPNWFWKLLGYK